MRTIALITDFGYTDNFAGVIKGVMLRVYPRINIVDITHNISSYDIKEGAFILLKSYRFFPKKTIFLVVVDPKVGTKRKVLVIKTKNYYFIGPDNGVLYPAVKEDKIQEAVSFKRHATLESATFHGRDVFAPLSAELAKGKKIISLGNKIKKIASFNLPKPRFHNNTLWGEILYIDKFGNIVTNITKKDLSKLNTSGGFLARLNNRTIRKVYETYSYASLNTPFFIEGSFGYLEISIKEASAKDYFKLKNTGKMITVQKI